MKSLRSFIKNSIFTPSIIGKLGEDAIANKLNWTNFFGKSGKMLRNVYIPYDNNKTTEIDLLYITQKGIFVIESKNLSGYIFGNENNKNWMATLYAGKNLFGIKKVEKYPFYNPVWQNRTHINVLKKYLKMDIPTFSIIVFSNRCEFKNVFVTDPLVSICKQNSFSLVMQHIWNTSNDVLTEMQINSIYNKLHTLSSSDTSIKEAHIASINTNIHSTTKCPRCGKELVLRTSKKSANKGHQFWGCSDYQRCTYTRNL